MKYTGWKIYDKVIIVENTNLIYGYPQGYVVDASDDKQLNSALNWATSYKNVNREEYLKEHSFELENSNFELEVYSGPNGSYQGGKLSFSNCIVSHADKKWVIGINTQWLMNLIKQSDFKMGKCQSKLKFARNQGNVALLHEGMVEYSNALSDKNIRENKNIKKTSKWEVGNTYDTMTLSTLYLGQVLTKTRYETEDIERNDYLTYRRYYTYNYNVYNEYKVKEILIDAFKLKKLLNIDSSQTLINVSELVDKFIDTLKIEEDKEIELNKGININKDKYKQSYATYNLTRLFEPSNIVKKTARVKGEFSIKLDIPLDEALSKILESIRSYYIRHSEIITPYVLDYIMVSTNLNENQLNTVDKEILLALNKKYNNATVSETLKLNFDC